MQQEAALDLALLDIVHELLVFFRAQRRGYQRLRLASRKECRAVGTRQPTTFAGNWPNFGKTSPIWPTSMVQNIVAENLFLEMVKGLLGRRTRLRLVLGIALDH